MKREKKATFWGSAVPAGKLVAMMALAAVLSGMLSHAAATVNLSTYTIPALPTPSTVAASSGGYLTNDITMPQPLYPANKASGLATPLPSNDWWQSLLIKPLGDSTSPCP